MSIKVREGKAGFRPKAGAVLCFLILVSLDLCCYTWAFSSCSNQELLFLAVHRLLIVVASVITEHRL